MDPFQIQNHMHLLGAGQLKKNIRQNASRLITSGTDRAIRAIEGFGFHFNSGQVRDMTKLDKKIWSLYSFYGII